MARRDGLSGDPISDSPFPENAKLYGLWLAFSHKTTMRTNRAKRTTLVSTHPNDAFTEQIDRSSLVT